MKKKFVSNSQESVRMFKSDLLESLIKGTFSGAGIYFYAGYFIYCITEHYLL